MPASRLAIVTNLNRGQVSWANSFCDAMSQAGAEILDRPHDPERPALFIGDDIPWETIPHHHRAGYFLAAADGTPSEARNIKMASMTSTVSSAEKIRSLHFFGDSSVHVDGFPIDFSELDRIDSDRQYKTPILGFVGRSDTDKGPDLELEIASIARKMGAKIVHISNTPNRIAPELEQIGAEIFKPATRSEYLSRLAMLGCVINTSPRESLYVSGIEATRLGVPVIAPHAESSGIYDWNIEERFFDATSPEMATSLAIALATTKSIDTPDVSRYAANLYYDRIIANLEQAS